MEIDMYRLRRFNELELCLMNQYPNDFRKRWLGTAMLFCKIILHEEKLKEKIKS